MPLPQQSGTTYQRAKGLKRLAFKRRSSSDDIKSKRQRQPPYAQIGFLMTIALFAVFWWWYQREVLTEQRLPLDFIVAGFSKAGTTTLLYALRNHPEISMNSNEESMVGSVTRTETHVYNVLQTNLEKINKENTKRGIKCPTALYGPQTIGRLTKWYPEIKWIVGLRHPLWQVQSYYNYRITEAYDKYNAMPTWKRFLWYPTFRKLSSIYFSNFSWKNISRFSHRFEFFLSQFVSNKPTWVKDEQPSLYEVYPTWQRQFADHKDTILKAASSTEPRRLFLYTTDQLEERSLRKALQEYLGLSKPIPELGHQNINHFVKGAYAHPEVVDLCDAAHAKLKNFILKDAAITAEWIQYEMLPHVTVSDHDSFVRSLESWKLDPCQSSANKNT